jgi:tetratricopeptide (TPR) repeat protein
LAGRHDSLYRITRAEEDLRAAANASYPHQARALATFSALEQMRGKVDEANLAASRAYEADAYLRDAPAIVFRLFHTSLDLKRYDEASAWCEQGRRTYAREWLFALCPLSLMALSPEAKLDVTKAWNFLVQLDTVTPSDVRAWLRPEMMMLVGAVLGRASLSDSAERVIARARQQAPNDVQMLYYEALARVSLSQPQRAAVLLAELIRRAPNLLPSLRSNPSFSALWKYPELSPMQ